MNEMQAMVSKIVANPFTRIPFFLSIIAGAVVSIAAGFYATFQLIVILTTRL